MVAAQFAFVTCVIVAGVCGAMVKGTGTPAIIGSLHTSNSVFASVPLITVNV